MRSSVIGRRNLSSPAKRIQIETDVLSVDVSDGPTSSVPPVLVPASCPRCGRGAAALPFDRKRPRHSLAGDRRGHQRGQSAGRTAVRGGSSILQAIVGSAYEGLSQVGQAPACLPLVRLSRNADFRRARFPGGTGFFIIVTHRRRRRCPMMLRGRPWRFLNPPTKPVLPLRGAHPPPCRCAEVWRLTPRPQGWPPRSAL